MITANTTDDGAAVYLHQDGSWTPRLSEAHAIADEADCEAALKAARRQERHVCDPYSFRVVLGPEGPEATNTREQIRGSGPTTPLRQSAARPQPSA